MLGQASICRGALLAGQIQAMPAQIVAASLEQGNLHRATQRTRNQGQIPAKELILQGLSPGGHHSPHARGQQRHQISKRLANARAGFHHQMLAHGQRIGDGVRHGHLGLAGRITWQYPRQRAISAEQIGQRGHRSHYTLPWGGLPAPVRGAMLADLAGPAPPSRGMVGTVWGSHPDPRPVSAQSRGSGQIPSRLPPACS